MWTLLLIQNTYTKFDTLIPVRLQFSTFRLHNSPRPGEMLHGATGILPEYSVIANILKNYTDIAIPYIYSLTLNGNR